MAFTDTSDNLLSTFHACKMGSLKELLKSKIITMLQEVNPPGRWKHLVVDQYALELLNSCCKMSDILSENVTVVEGLMNKRPQTDKEAIYFISNTITSINALISDFDKKPIYRGAYVYCIASVSDASMRKIKQSNALSYLRSFKELNIDFVATDAHCFSLEVPDTWFTVFNPEAPSLLTYELSTMAKRIASVMGTMGEYPHIRYFSRPALFSTAAQKSVTSELAFLVQNELDLMCRTNPDFPPPSDFKRPILIILDRSVDVLAPLLHEFSYESMIADLIQLRDGKYKDEEGKDVNLDESDQIWEQTKTWHIAKVLEFLPEELRRFTADNEAARYELGNTRGNTTTDKLDGLRGAVGAMGQYTDIKAKIARHTNLCQRLMSIYNARSLDRLSALEQNLVMTDPAENSSRFLSEVTKMLEDESIEHMDKVRLLLLAIVSREGVSDKERQRLFDSFRVGTDVQALNNLGTLQVRLSSNIDKRKPDTRNPYSLGANCARSRGTQFEFENSRYTPTLKYIVEDQLRGNLDTHWFPWIKEPPQETINTPTETTTQRKKPTWASKKRGTPSTETPAVTDRRANGPRIIVFCVGGISHSESVALSKLGDTLNRDIILGSTHLWEPDTFVEGLKSLHRTGSTASVFLDYQRPVKREPRSQRSRYDDERPDSRSSGRGDRYDRQDDRRYDRQDDRRYDDRRSDRQDDRRSDRRPEARSRYEDESRQEDRRPDRREREPRRQGSTREDRGARSSPTYDQDRSPMPRSRPSQSRREDANVDAMRNMNMGDQPEEKPKRSWFSFKK
ncbi:Sec1-like protein [Gorgonomyces haynaldii]|nr:Sec1-like protein [Gorgonomyces haynaldii]